MDHVVHDPTSPALTMDWVHYRVTVSEFLLKAPRNHFCAGVSLHAKQFVPIRATPPAINLNPAVDAGHGGNLRPGLQP
jgi:hypothetical protein